MLLRGALGSVLFMKRDDILAEIARIDEEVNRTVSSVELPWLDVRPFPYGIWIFAALCYAWTHFGYRIPGAYAIHMETAPYSRYLGIICAVVGLLATINWLFRGRGYRAETDAYVQATRRARDLQERRRELQSELKVISSDE